MNDHPTVHIKQKAIDRVSDAVLKSLERCTLCPRRCASNRMRGRRGYCRAPFKPMVYSFAPHHGEEPVLSGKKGSGTIFFSNCTMQCVYCQNYIFSQLDAGEEVSIEELSRMMLDLEARGCHNINLVSPTQYVPQIILATGLAVGKGLTIPLVYNTGGYELVETLKLLEGIIDIYLPDMRYSESAMAEKYSDAPDYVRYNRDAVHEMHRQAGDLTLDGSGLAVQGLLVRLLVLPRNISGTVESLRFIASEVSTHTFISLMSQYHPTYKANHFAELSRGITPKEYDDTVAEAKRLGLHNGWIQEGPIELNERFFGPHIEPQRPIGE